MERAAVSKPQNCLKLLSELYAGGDEPAAYIVGVLRIIRSRIRYAYGRHYFYCANLRCFCQHFLCGIEISLLSRDRLTGSFLRVVGCGRVVSLRSTTRYFPATRKGSYQCGISNSDKNTLRRSGETIARQWSVSETTRNGAHSLFKTPCGSREARQSGASLSLQGCAAMSKPQIVSIHAVQSLK